MTSALFQLACLVLCLSDEFNKIQSVLIMQKQILIDLQNKEKEIDKNLIQLKEIPVEDVKQFIEKYPARLKAKKELEKYEAEYKKNKEDVILGEESFQKVIKGRAALTFSDREAKAKFEDLKKENNLRFIKEKDALENQKKRTVEDIARTTKIIEENELKLKELMQYKTNEIVKSESLNTIPTPSPTPLRTFNHSHSTETENTKDASGWGAGFIISFLLIIIGWFFIKSIKTNNSRTPTIPAKHFKVQNYSQPKLVLNGPGLFNVNVVGESHYQDELLSICGPKKNKGTNLVVDAVLILENTNIYDKNAVLVAINGLKVGYLSRENAIAYRKKIASLNQPNSSFGCKAKIVGGWDDGKGDEGFFGVKLDLPS